VVCFDYQTFPQHTSSWTDISQTRCFLDSHFLEMTVSRTDDSQTVHFPDGHFDKVCMGNFMALSVLYRCAVTKLLNRSLSCCYTVLIQALFHIYDHINLHESQKQKGKSLSFTETNDNYSCVQIISELFAHKLSNIPAIQEHSFVTCSLFDMPPAACDPKIMKTTGINDVTRNHILYI